MGTLSVKADVECSYHDANGNPEMLSDEAKNELNGLLTVETTEEINKLNDYAINYSDWTDSEC